MSGLRVRQLEDAGPGPLVPGPRPGHASAATLGRRLRLTGTRPDRRRWSPARPSTWARARACAPGPAAVRGRAAAAAADGSTQSRDGPGAVTVTASPVTNSLRLIQCSHGGGGGCCGGGGGGGRGSHLETPEYPQFRIFYTFVRY